MRRGCESGPSNPVEEKGQTRYYTKFRGTYATPMTSAELSVAFFLQMAFILAACRAVGWVARRCGQPQVVGEMIAGVLIWS